MEQIEQRNKMAAKPVFPLLMSMAFPPMLSMLVQSMYNIVDSMFVARFSQDALTAVSLAFPLQNLVLAVAVGTGVGVNSYISRKLGAQDQDAANAAVTHGFLLSFAHAVFFVIFGLVAIRPFFRLFTDSAEIFSLACDYSYIVVLGAFAQLFHIMVEKLLQATGRMLAPMLLQAIGAIANIILDPILIFGLFGAPKMGVTGAAVATVIGQCVACIVAGICNHKFNHEVRLSFRGFRPDLKIIGHIYAVGIPSIIMQSISSIMTYCMNLILVQFTVTATAIFGVYFKLQSFFFMPVFGLNNGITPIIAYNYGARHRKRMLKTVKVSMFIAFCFTFIGFLAFEFIPKTLLGLFSASEDMLTIGIPALRIIGIHYLIAWFCIIAGTVFQALGKAVFSMIVSIMRQLFVLVPAAYILASIGGLHAVWWSFPIAEIISLIVSVTFLVVINRTIIQKIPEA